MIEDGSLASVAAAAATDGGSDDWSMNKTVKWRREKVMVVRLTGMLRMSRLSESTRRSEA